MSSSNSFRRNRTLDLHGYTVADAIAIFRTTYDECQRAGGSHVLDVVHGVGSVAFAGAIRRELRALLDRHNMCLRYECGEDVDGNGGHTLVYPERPLVEVHVRHNKRIPIPPAGDTQSDP
jgi:DNA-nicking Smr family endonuclease